MPARAYFHYSEALSADWIRKLHHAKRPYLETTHHGQSDVQTVPRRIALLTGMASVWFLCCDALTLMVSLWSLFFGALTGWLFSLFIGLRTDLPLCASLNTVLGAVAAVVGTWIRDAYLAPEGDRTVDWVILDMLAPVGAAVLLLGFLTFVRARRSR